MVKLYAISLFYKGVNKTKLLQEAYDLESLKFSENSSAQKLIR
jgi:hypothetical protein